MRETQNSQKDLWIKPGNNSDSEYHTNLLTVEILFLQDFTIS